MRKITLFILFSIIFTLPASVHAEDRGWITINTVPEKSEVLLNGTPKGETPLKLTLSPEIYEFEIKREGYETFRVTVEIKKDIEKTVTYSLLKLGRIVVKSDPDGAVVRLNNAPVGRTPLTLENLDKGTYLISIKKEMHGLFETEVKTGPGKKNVVDIKLATVNPEMMVPVQSGYFMMGTKNGAGDEVPENHVALDSFMIDKYEVTNGEYKKCVKKKKCAIPGNEAYFKSKKYRNHPAVYVNWKEAAAFCKWKGKRLPTEAEWEKAARGTEMIPLPWGKDRDFLERANLIGKKDKAEKLSVIGNYDKGRSPYGAMDMIGNAREWTADEYSAAYYGEMPKKNPKGPKVGFFKKSKLKVIRGGSWADSAEEMRVTRRYNLPPGNYDEMTGFRCAMNN